MGKSKILCSTGALTLVSVLFLVQQKNYTVDKGTGGRALNQARIAKMQVKRKAVTIMVGTDGRFYNEFYDFDEDGKLNLYEYCVMEEEAFGITNGPVSRFSTK